MQFKRLRENAVILDDFLLFARRFGHLRLCVFFCWFLWYLMKGFFWRAYLFCEILWFWLLYWLKDYCLLELLCCFRDYVLDFYLLHWVLLWPFGHFLWRKMSLFFNVINNLFNWSFLLYINSLFLWFYQFWFDKILFHLWLTDILFMILFTISEMLVISLLNELPLAHWALDHRLIPVNFIAYPIELFDCLNLPTLGFFQRKLCSNVFWQSWNWSSLRFLFEFLVIYKLFFAYLLMDLQTSQTKFSSTDETNQYFWFLDLCLYRFRLRLLDFLAILLTVSQVLLIWLWHESPSTSRTMHHSFVFEKSRSFAIELFDFFSSPISLCLNDLYFSLCESWWFPPFFLRFFRLFIFEFFNALWIVYLQTQQPEFSSADTADQSPRFLRLALVSLTRLVDMHLFVANIDMNLQTFFIKSPATELASR